MCVFMFMFMFMCIGFKITVEKSTQRIFDDEEYERFVKFGKLFIN